MPSPTKQNTEPDKPTQPEVIPAVKGAPAPHPIANTEKPMNFFQALTLVFEHGTKMQREEWGNPRAYVAMDDAANLCIVGGKNALTGVADTDGRLHPYAPSLGDYQGEDWVRCN